MMMMKTPMHITFTFLLTLFAVQGLLAQEGETTRVNLEGAREVVAEINGGFGTLYLKRGSGSSLMTLREKYEDEPPEKAVRVDYHVRNGVGYLTVDLGHEDGDDMNALSCLFGGSDSRTWYMTISDRVPVRFDVSLGAGKAALNLTGIHVRGLKLEAGAGSVLMKVEQPNPEDIGEITISAGVGSVKAHRLGNLRFHSLDFDGGIGEYHLDCSGALPDGARIKTDVGVGSLVVVLPYGVGARAITSDHILNSTKMYRFVRQADETYTTENYAKSKRRVLLDLDSGLGSVSVRWAK